MKFIIKNRKAILKRALRVFNITFFPVYFGAGIFISLDLFINQYQPFFQTSPSNIIFHIHYLLIGLMLFPALAMICYSLLRSLKAIFLYIFYGKVSITPYLLFGFSLISFSAYSIPVIYEGTSNVPLTLFELVLVLFFYIGGVIGFYRLHSTTKNPLSS
jgi:hypothetical protein